MLPALKVPPPGFEDLSVEDQIDYVQALWDTIAARPDRVPVPEWHLKLLDERLAELERDPDEGVSWEEFRADLDAEADGRERLRTLEPHPVLGEIVFHEDPSLPL